MTTSRSTTNRRIALALAACLTAASFSAFAATAASAAAPAASAPAAAKKPATTAGPRHLKPPASVLDRIRRAGVLRVGVLSQPPWAMQAAGGEWIGFDVELGKRLADDLGVRVQYVRVGWSNAADDVAAGKIDVAAGLWPGPKRALVVNFSNPYAAAEVTLVANRERADSLDTKEGFNVPGVTIGVRAGGLSESVVSERLPNAKRVAFDSDEAELAALTAGEVTAIAARTPLPELIVGQSDGALTVPLDEPLSRRSEVFAIVRGDTDLLAYLNAWIRFRDETGWLEKRRAYWFNGTAWQDRL